jgi:feruloyl esterase
MKQSKRFMIFVFSLSFMLLISVAPAFSVPPKVDYSPVATQANCELLKGYVEGLTDATFNKSVTNVTATWYPANPTPTPPAQPTPEYCQVTGWMWPEIKFQVTMPTVWNERYQMNGGGGWDGSLRFTNSPSADGYATSGANGGYMSANWPSSCGSFGLEETYFTQFYNSDPDPTKWYPKAGSGGYYTYPDAASYVGQGNHDACQKVVDFGYRHLYETPVIAKKIIKQYYLIDPKKSYYYGGSCGGKEGQISAQKFPELYDGFWIGYPLGGHLAVTFRGTWDTLKGADLAKQADPSCVPGGGVTCPSVYVKYKAPLHYKTVYDKCDSVDGLVDGVIDDPLKCKFNAMTDLPACAPAEEAAEGVGGVYSSTCFTLAQRQALKEIYAGPHNSSGKPWYPGQPISAEYMANGPSGYSSGFTAAINDGMAPCMFANIALDPPQGPNFDITKFNWDTDPIAMQESTCQACIGSSCQTYKIHNTLDGITISPRPAFNMGGLEAVYEKRAKIVQTHGWSDALVTALAASRELYETSLQTMGVQKTKSFWKLYLVPGGGHGGGGLSAWPTNTSAFNAMVDWVENGIEPGVLIGSRNANVDANYPAARTRPSCPYPQVARYLGSGSIDEAANFVCVNIVPTKVKIEPETINLKSNGVFTAFFTLPHDHHKKFRNGKDSFDITVVCEGAPAIRGTANKHGKGFIAKFRTQDLINITPGDKITFTAYAIVDHHGETLAFEGSDTVRVLDKEEKPPKPCKNKNKCN